MWYFVVFGAFAVWVFLDAKKRQENAAGWAIGTFLLGSIVAPVYFAKRNLFAGEVREGGTGWNVAKNIALYWTLTCVAAGVAGMVGVSDVVSSASTEAEQAGAAIGATLGLGFIGFIWFGLAAPALVIGLILKKSSIVERGPTGSLATTSSVIPPIPTTP